jgi:hypothetical protein
MKKFTIVMIIIALVMLGMTNIQTEANAEFCETDQHNPTSEICE